ncbi:MAG: NAD(P)H-hydrate dehydratase [Raineya sp.]|jgi:NAD(P)H-hydrate epimerase|nr:NAD(P)H-hydrate dehydratase [Raineya sp.]
MKLLTAEQIKALDQFTIQNKPITSIDLMERASYVCVDWILKNIEQEHFTIFCGRGNNGGDGLAIARLLFQKGKEVRVFILEVSNPTNDFQANLQRLPQEIQTSFINENTLNELVIANQTIIIDAIFGVGLSKPLSGWVGEIVKFINFSKMKVISIDIPTGMYANLPQEKNIPIIKANYTLTFHKPKLNMLLPQTGNYAGNLIVLDIGLLTEYEKEFDSQYFINTFPEIASLYSRLQPRSTFSHKGSYGHSLLAVGSYGKAGAATLAAKACLRAGTGLLSVFSAECNHVILQTSVPEAMFIASETNQYISGKIDYSRYNAIGVGSGIGTHKETQTFLKFLIQEAQIPLVLDADALNILAENPTWLAFLPAECILTPHPKEFERLVGSWQNDYECLEFLQNFARKNNVYVVLKGAYSKIATPDGKILINTSGNAGMATGGSGDVLTGIITGLLAQHYTPLEAVCIGIYIHGLSADLASKDTGQISLIASDIIEYLPQAFFELKKYYI